MGWTLVTRRIKQYLKEVAGGLRPRRRREDEKESEGNQRGAPTMRNEAKKKEQVTIHKMTGWERLLQQTMV